MTKSSVRTSGAAHTNVRKLSRRRRLVFWATLALLLLLAFEILVRGAFAVLSGPSVLLYGTPYHRNQVAQKADRMKTLRENPSYFKYHPKEKNFDRDP